MSGRWPARQTRLARRTQRQQLHQGEQQDEQGLEELRELDEQRLQALVHANTAALLGYLQRRVQPVEDAADLLSETLLIAWRRVWELPSQDEAARMWLFVTARNVLATHRRSQVRHEAMAQRLREHISDEHRRGRYDAQASSGEEFERVHQAVRELPEAQQELVVLVHWDGFSITEAAALMGVSASTARSRYAAARVGLARRLQVPASEAGEAEEPSPHRHLRAVPVEPSSSTGALDAKV